MKKCLSLLAVLIGGLVFSCRAHIEPPEAERPVPYKVSYMLQNLDDDDYFEAESVSLEGMPGEMTDASARSYEGFLLRDDVEQLVILPDASTVVKIYYDRKTFEITFSAGEGVFLGAGEDGGDVSTVKINFRYGQKPVPPQVYMEGYVAEWPDFDSVSENQNYEPVWTGCFGVKYFARHLLESLDGETFEEDLESTEELEGTAGALSELGDGDAKSFSGFTYKEVKNTVINGKGTSFVDFYYTRNSYKLTFEAPGGTFGGGSSSAQVELKFGERVVAPEVSRAGYIAGWTSLPETCPSKNESYTVSWTQREDTIYKIKHYWQNLDGDGWTEQSSDESRGQGKTDSQTALTASDAKNYAGDSVSIKLTIRA